MSCVSFQSAVPSKTNWLRSAVWRARFYCPIKVLNQGSLEESGYLLQRILHRSPAGTGWVIQPWLSVHCGALNAMAVQSRRLGTLATNLALKVSKVPREPLVFSPCWEVGEAQSRDQWRRGQRSGCNKLDILTHQGGQVKARISPRPFYLWSAEKYWVPWGKALAPSGNLPMKYSHQPAQRCIW